MKTTESYEFRALAIGDTFDCVNPDYLINSFYLRCTKISPRKYQDSNGIQHRIGTINCRVYHVKRKEEK